MATKSIKAEPDILEMTVEELEKYRNTIVKSANQKARRLKKWAEQYNETHDRPTKVAKFALASYQKENQVLYGSDVGKEKRKDSTIKDVNALRHEIANARKFMSSVSSSGSQYIKKGQKTVDTIKARYGLELSVDDLYTFFESPQYKAWKEKFHFNSLQTVISIGNQLRDNDLTLKQFLSEYFDVSGDNAKVNDLQSNVSDELPIEWVKQQKKTPRRKR